MGSIHVATKAFVAVAFFAVVIVGIGYNTTAHVPGLYITGRASATDTERAENMIAIGNDVTIVIRDSGIFNAQVEPLIGRDVRFCLVEP